MQYVCSVCGYIYDEAKEGPWENLPENWRCPLCGASRSDFRPLENAAPVSPSPAGSDLKLLNALETSALCSNLARGCEKQYDAESAAAFRSLADWFRARSDPFSSPSMDALLERVEQHLSRGFPEAGEAARQAGDRGALRALTWSEKVSRVLRALLKRYQEEGDAMLAHTGVYVCTICGYVHIGEPLPEVCPVCKVPSRKFERIGG